MATSLTVQCVEGATAGALRVALQAAHAPTVVLTGRSVALLTRELKGYRRAVRYLVDLATATNRPIGMHAEHATGGRTVFIPPRHWSPERLAGWIAGRHEELAAQFGEIAQIGGPSA
jgi:hypothetical protein